MSDTRNPGTRDAEPKFKPNTPYTFAEIGEAAGQRPVYVRRHLGQGYIAVTDVSGDFSQYDFKIGEGGRYYLYMIDGELIETAGAYPTTTLIYIAIILVKDLQMSYENDLLDITIFAPALKDRRKARRALERLYGGGKDATSRQPSRYQEVTRRDWYERTYPDGMIERGGSETVGRSFEVF